MMLESCNFANMTSRKLQKLGLVILAIAFGMSLLPIPFVRAIEEDSKLAKSSEDLPLVESANLDTDLDVPFSQPVKIQDPFEGEFIGIFDRHFFFSRLLNTSGRVEVVSLWSPDTIRFLLAYRNRDCNFSSGFSSTILSRNCLALNTALKITDVYLKIGEVVFRLEGKNSRFEVDDSLATALRNSPAGKIDIRLVTASGESVDSEIGEETVKAWKAVY